MSHKTKNNAGKQTDVKKSIVVVPSRIGATSIENLDGVEATEIAAEVSVPTDGGWGWVVVAASFSSAFILDGIFFTFGSIFSDMTDDLGVESTLVALINAIAVALYFVSGPVTSALINRFGFRACSMSGSVILSFSFLCAYFATSYFAILLFYGLISGFGGCLVLMPSAVVVGFYFERLRAIAIAIAGVGSSLGIMIMFSVNSYIVKITGWRIVTLFHSGLFGLLYFIAMAYRPLLSITVTQTTETNDPTRTVTYLPSLANTAGQKPMAKSKREGVAPTATERLFSAVSNANFPTAASVVEEGVIAQPTTTQAGPSSAAVSKLTLTARNPTGGLSRRQLNQVQSMVSRANIKAPDKDKINIAIANADKEAQETKRSWWTRLCHWEQHIAEARPMYRDDAFYEGRIEKLPAYQKSMMETTPETRTGLEYQLAVSRAVTTADLEERKGVYTTAVRRILATMMDPLLLKSCSFLLLCCSGVFTYLGLLIPYVFLPDRNLNAGIDPKHCNLFVSVIGFCNAIGRIFAGAMACKFEALLLYKSACVLAGIGTMAYNFSFNIYYQYFCCVIFGIFISCVSALRSMVIVDCYGLDKLTNATGIILMAQGLGSLISTPLSSLLKKMFGYTISFYVAGSFIVCSGLVLMPVKRLVAKEKKERERKNLPKPTANVQKK